MEEWKHESLVCIGLNITNSSLLSSFQGEEGPLKSNFIFGGGKNVFGVNRKLCKITFSLPFHTKNITCVNLFKTIDETLSSHPQRIASGSADTQIAIWIFNNEKEEWEIEAVLKGHKDTITCIQSLTMEDGSTLIVSTSADCTVNIWNQIKEKEPWSLIQTLDFKPRMMESAAITLLPVEKIPVIALGGVDCLIHLYIQSKDLKFNKLASLQGHEDWIRSLSFATNNSGQILLASASQDTKIRIWKLSNLEQQSDDIVKSLDNLSKDTTISHKGHFFKTTNHRYSILLESVLSAHEEWVHSVVWKPVEWINGKRNQEMCILSASMDKSMIIWRPSDKMGGVWIDEVRVGELGGSTLGFYGGIFSSDGKSIIAHGYNGSFHLWSRQPNEENGDTYEWKSELIISGHFAPVVGLSWDPYYNYLVSASEDQTSRCFAEWSRKDFPLTLHEIGRPALHGHDLSCVCFINELQHRMVLGAEEKVIRVFDAPQTFVETLKNITSVDIQNDASHRPLGANVPPLGLSNKPVFQGENNAEEALIEDGFEGKPPPIPISHQTPPCEDHLLQSTLWPEIQKLYGHPNEIVTVCCSPDGTLMASSCKGSQLEESSIRIWDTQKWKEIGKLTAHKLTVVQMEFSHNGKYLMSASRDRQFCIFKIEKTINGEWNFSLEAKIQAHERIIWSCSWSYNDELIATGSRDKLVKFWKKDNEKEWKCIGSLPPFSKPVTSVSFASLPESHPLFEYFKDVLAVGLEDGSISLWKFDFQSKNSRLFFSFRRDLAHSDVVTHIKWRNSCLSNVHSVQIATSSSDHSVKLHTLSFSIKN